MNRLQKVGERSLFPILLFRASCPTPCGPARGRSLSLLAKGSLNSYGYSPQTIEKMASLSHFFATIPSSPTGSQRRFARNFSCV